LREKLIDVSRSLSKSALSLQVRAGRGDSITLGIENRDLITVVALVVTLIALDANVAMLKEVLAATMALRAKFGHIDEQASYT